VCEKSESQVAESSDLVTSIIADEEVEKEEEENRVIVDECKNEEIKSECRVEDVEE